MRIYQLRTYHLRTGAATEAYGQLWEDLAASLRKYGIETHGVFTSPSKHNAIVVLVSYPEELDPALAAEQYATSLEYRTAIAGFETTQLIRDDELLLHPLPASSLR